ncbi:tetratricopeptide repeat protein [Novosphingobium olei]|uniref:Tetratricopeptide repeat protein n=1 Tax=Novosphingobium olei TaxID=2728851 RepID=A0A7Y0BQA8_9SPHN|nr:hypothetical protein [Novosphingobium olei]NML94423.1 hypothetical protein [Novosphingobium olei]
MSVGGERRRPAGTLLVAVSAIAYAALALASGLDRAGALDPVLAGMLPTAIQAQSLRNKATTVQSIGDAARARALAEKAVERTPIEPGSTAVLGAALLGANDAAGADRVFRVAAQMGWRIPLTQLYWMQTSLAVEDYPNAAVRLDALLRQTPTLLSNRKLLDPLEQTEDGRKALADRLVERPNWLVPYTTDVWEVPPPVLNLRRAVLLDVANQGRKLGCVDVSPFVQREIALGNPRGAHDVWIAHCPGAGKAMIYDGDFQQAEVSQTRSSLSWTFVGNGNISVFPEPGQRPGQRALAVDGKVAMPTVFVRQMLLLPAGRYRVTWTALSESGAPTTRIVAGLDCGHGVEWQTGEAGPNGLRSAVLESDGSCDAPWLSFGLAPGDGVARLTGVAMSTLGQAKP